MQFTANYHTHTYRCGHASGEDRAYIEEAIQAGITTLGFADHAPMPFPSGHRSGHRMPLNLADDYFASLSALKKEYAGQIELHIGVEAEFYPETFDLFWNYIKDYPLEYMLLGQHFIGREEDGLYSGSPSPDERKLARYVDNVIEAIGTGKFLYVAHPDLINFTGNDAVYYKEMMRLCQAAKAANIPLEINRLGYFEHRVYPCDRFFAIAGEACNMTVIGSDAHSPEVFRDHASIEGCAALAAKHHLSVMPSLTLRKDFTKS